jgi:hypothetical protein
MKEPTKEHLKGDLNGMFGRAMALERALKLETKRRKAAERKIAELERLFKQAGIVLGYSAKREPGKTG